MGAVLVMKYTVECEYRAVVHNYPDDRTAVARALEEVTRCLGGQPGINPESVTFRLLED